MTKTKLPRFRRDNTEGYGKASLRELNRRFEAALRTAEPIADDIRKSQEDWLAEQVERDFWEQP